MLHRGTRRHLSDRGHCFRGRRGRGKGGTLEGTRRSATTKEAVGRCQTSLGITRQSTRKLRRTQTGGRRGERGGGIVGESGSENNWTWNGVTVTEIEMKMISGEVFSVLRYDIAVQYNIKISRNRTPDHVVQKHTVHRLLFISADALNHGRQPLGGEQPNKPMA